MDFRTKYSRVIITTCPGHKEIPVFGFVKNKETGEKELKQVGVKNQYAEIQSYRDSVDLNKLLARFTNGDLGALDQRDSFYADVTDVPSDFRSMLDVAMYVQSSFDALDPSDQKKFGSADAWLSSLMNQTDTSGRKEDVPESVPADIDLSKKGVENGSEN